MRIHNFPFVSYITAPSCLLQKAKAVDGVQSHDSVLVHRRCVLLAVVGLTNPSSSSIARLLDYDYLSFVKKWLEEILSGKIGGVDLLLHLLSNIASLPVTKSVVKSSGMGKLVGSLEKHSMITSSPNAAVVKERIQLVKDSWSSSVKARKSQDLPKETSQAAGDHLVQTIPAPEPPRLVPKRPSEPMNANDASIKRAKLADEPKKASSSFSSLLKKVSGTNGNQNNDLPPPGNEQNGTAKAPQAKKLSKRVKWADHFGGNLSVAQTLETDDSVDGASGAGGLEASSSWSDRKKRDRLREKELLASAKRAKLTDDDDADDPVPLSSQMKPSMAWRVPSLLPELPNVTKAELSSNEKSLQESRMRTVPRVHYLTEKDVASSPNPLTDVEIALDMTSQSSADLEAIPFFVPLQESATAAVGGAATVSPSLYQDVASTLQGLVPNAQQTQHAYGVPAPYHPQSGATPEYLQSLGLPMFLLGQDIQALQTITNSPGLLGTFVDASGQYDQQRLLDLVRTLSVSNGSQNHGRLMHVPAHQPASTSIYGLPAVASNASYAAPAPYGAAVNGGFRPKSDAGNLHVSGFGPSTTQTDIIQLFSPYVRVDEVFMKGTFAFVNTSDPLNAQMAREALTGTLLGGMPIRINPAQRKPREASAYGPSSHSASVPMGGLSTAGGMPQSIVQAPHVPPQQTFPSSFPSGPGHMAPPMQNVDDVRDDRGNPATKNLFVAGYGPSTTEQQLRDLFSQHAEILGVVTKGAFSFVNTSAREQAVACRQAFIGHLVNGGALRINFAKESGRLGTSFDLTYGKETGPNARRGPPVGLGGPPMAYGVPPPTAYGAQPGFGAGGGGYYGP
ncbi:hypothetical protein MPSEU_000916100 [Mayamaea pseudoterrestris]|nr:hypothetical protein MPSEU_000916100 [Mayamaea pseudoterrestris]